MRIATCLIVVLAVAVLVSGAEQKQSMTRTAGCIVRITTDPEMIPLNRQTVEHLVRSHAVLDKATREVLELDIEANPGLYKCIEIEWLAQSIHQIGNAPAPNESGQRLGRTPRSGGQSQDEAHDEMMKQLAEIYGDRYSPYFSSDESAPEEDANKTDAPGRMGGMGGMMGGGGMGGYGGGMMMGGGMGMGGMMGGGGMGGYGGGMMGGVYGSPPPRTPGAATQQSVTLRLQAKAPEYAKPVAQELLQAIVTNLRRSLEHTYEMYEGQVAELLSYKERQCQGAQEELEEAMGTRPDQTAEGTQLDDALQTLVDLSMLAPEMPFSEAIETLKNAVEPPLPLVVLWKELLDSCDIEPTTPIDMDGLYNVKLKTALRTLLEAVGGGFADLSYRIDDDVIVICEGDVQSPEPTLIGARVEVDIRDLTLQRRELARRLQRLELDFATTEARRRAIDEQIAMVRHEAERKMKEDSIAGEMQNLVEMSQKRLDALARQFETGSLGAAELSTARESLTRAKIELARRRVELMGSAGGDQLKEFNSELSRMAIDMAAKRAELEFLRRQLAETEDQLAQASTFDPRATRIRMAREALAVAETQVMSLRARLTNLQFPTVTVIGAN
jgi:hypothetical protein